ncbi:PFGI-1 class ICE element type IV pilus protein PilL2 [Pectobacterium odoriferum]|uniref:PFGI-1 class ICE element type IV pilus protein PilL2 n=1 Tax=Pectobacterium odoriferum TaxID=78398 RepID=UPI000CD05628|nr:TcpQ domain-containing protein [Pectobacterium odoriferum]POE02638.1 pilus assembly protein [Pectobacterium odoriferum]
MTTRLIRPPRNTPALACLSAAAMLVAGCAQQTTTSSVSRQNVSPRVNDIYQNRSPEVVRYDRYTLVSTRPADSQRDPLNQMIDITMPPQLVRSVGDGFRYLLLESGYSLCPSSSAMFTELLSRPLPGVQRSIGPVRLSEALQIVAGPAWRLRVDDVNREVCFTLRDEYRSFAPVAPSTPMVTVPIAPRQSGSPSSVTSVQGTLKPDSQPLPVPALTTIPSSASASKTVTAGVAGNNALANKPISATAQPLSSASVNGKTLVGQGATTVKSSVPASTVKPVVTVPTTALPPAPAALPAQQKLAPAQQSTTPAALASTTAPKSPFVPGKPVSAQSQGTLWRAEVGTTLRESVNKWASEASCVNGGNWIVIWPVNVDYRIDAPLSFHGNFESVITQVFDLYRDADTPLFAAANRIQCLISVSDRPGERR